MSRRKVVLPWKEDRTNNRTLRSAVIPSRFAALGGATTANSSNAAAAATHATDDEQKEGRRLGKMVK